MRTQTRYEIRIEGHLGSSWSPWFDGLTIRHEGTGETVLSGPVVDQAALHGVLMKIRDLVLPLVAVEWAPSASDGSGILARCRVVRARPRQSHGLPSAWSRCSPCSESLSSGPPADR